MMPTDESRADELLAILRANRDLGPEFDHHTVEQIQRLYGTAHSPTTQTPFDVYNDLRDWHQRRELAREHRRFLRSERRASGAHWMIPAILIFSIPLMGLAGHYAHGLGVLAVLIFDVISVVLSMRSGERSQ